MEPGTVTTVTETGNELFRWLNDYGALKILAVLGIIYMVGTPIAMFAFIWKLGRPIARIADALDELKKIKEGS
jgi:hypothetical protein